MSNIHKELPADFQFAYDKWRKEIDELLEQCNDASKKLVLSKRGRNEVEFPHVAGSSLSERMVTSWDSQFYGRLRRAGGLSGEFESMESSRVPQIHYGFQRLGENQDS